MEIIGTLIGALIGAAIGSLYGAIILCVAAKWAIKESVAFGNAYVTVFISSFITSAVGVIVGAGAGAAKASAEAFNSMLMLMIPVGFLIQSGIIASRLKISCGKSALVVLTMFAIFIGIAIVAVGAIFIVLQIFSQSEG